MRARMAAISASVKGLAGPEFSPSCTCSCHRSAACALTGHRRRRTQGGAGGFPRTTGAAGAVARLACGRAGPTERVSTERRQRLRARSACRSSTASRPIAGRTSVPGSRAPRREPPPDRPGRTARLPAGAAEPERGGPGETPVAGPNVEFFYTHRAGAAAAAPTSGSTAGSDPRRQRAVAALPPAATLLAPLRRPMRGGRGG